MTFQAIARIGGNLGCPVVGRRVPKVGQALGTDKTAMDFRRRLPEIRWQSCLSPGDLVGDQQASPRLSIPRTRMRSGGSRQKKTRHLPTHKRSSPGRSLSDFTSPWPVAANVPGPRRSVPERRDQDAPDRALRQGGKLLGGSQAEPAADFLQADIVAWFRTGQIQLGRGLGINDFLLAQLRKKRNGHLHLSVRKGIHERLKGGAIGGHASIIASPPTS